MKTSELSLKNEEVEVAREKMEFCQTSLEDANAEKDKLSETLLVKCQELSLHKDRIIQLEELRTNLESQVNEQIARTDEQGQINQSLERKIAAMTSNENSEVHQMRTELTEKLNTIETLQAERTKLGDHVAQLQDELSHIRSQLKIAAENFEEKQNQVLKLERLLSEGDKASKLLADLQVEVGDLKEKLQEKTEELTGKEEEFENAKLKAQKDLSVSKSLLRTLVIQA